MSWVAFENIYFLFLVAATLHYLEETVLLRGIRFYLAADDHRGSFRGSIPLKRLLFRLGKRVEEKLWE